MIALAKNLTSPPSPNPPLRKLALERKPWAAWQRDLTRLYGLLGFKAVGIALAVVLGVTLWLDGSSKRLTALSQKQVTLQRDLTKMQALVNLRKKVEEALANTRTQAATEQARGLIALTREEAAASWQTELQGQLAGLQISDIKLTLAEPAKAQPFGPVVGFDAEFPAVPEQLINFVQAIANSNRLVCIPDLQLDISREQDWPRLKVRMRLEALYFQPDPSAKKGRPGGMPAAPAANKPAPPAPPLPPGKPGFP